ncbi:MAG: competence protein ComE [Methylotenera sp.]|nr:competence protein ComE [Oligoflexia bacterium]
MKIQSRFLVLAALLQTVVFSPVEAASIESHFNQNAAFHFTEPYSHRARVGENFEDVVLKQIQSTQAQIWVAIHELMLPRIAEALVGAKKSGKDVRVILENQYHVAFSKLTPAQVAALNPYMKEKYAEFLLLADAYGNHDGTTSPEEKQKADPVLLLEAAGIPVIDDTADGSKGSGLMHHKFMVLDQRRVLVSSANFTSSDFFGDFSNPASLGNPNAMLVISSSSLNRLFREEFLQMWGESGRKPRFGVKKTYRPHQQLALEDGTQIELAFSPAGKAVKDPDTANGLIATTLGAARKSVDFALFVFSEQSIGNALETAHDRGVRVRGLIEPSFAYRYYSELLDLLGITLLDPKCRIEPENHPWKNPVVTAGIPIIPKGDKLHHKFSVVDQQAVIFGSHNWSEAANRQNDETLMVIHDSSVAEQFETEFERIYSHSILGVPGWLAKKVNDDKVRCPHQP